MIDKIPTVILRMARNKSGSTQAKLAKILKVNASLISRLESSEWTDGQMAERYLGALQSDLGNEIITFFSEAWQHLERPDFRHPDREVMREAECALQTLKTFEDSSQFDPILQRPLTKVRERIIKEVEFIRHQDHSIAFIGEIGVGKTTALSFVMNLIKDEKDGPESIFPTGSGRTTVCEVAIKTTSAFGIAVAPLPEDKIRLLVTDLIKSGITSELERVIRNMANLGRKIVQANPPSDETTTIDPLKDLIDQSAEDVVVGEVMAKMELEHRTETQMILPEDMENSTEWLRSNIRKINNGLHPNFSIPERITVLLPREALRETPYTISVIDTKGVEGTTQRPDLMEQIENTRTITVLCCRFPDAPGKVPLSLVQETLDSGSDALDAERLCLLVLPREPEALGIINDEGEHPNESWEGYAIRKEQVERQFAVDKLPKIPINFFQVGADNPEDVYRWLTSRIKGIRAAKVKRIESHVSAVQGLVTNADVAKTREARRSIAETISQVAAKRCCLPGVKRPAYFQLLAETEKTHHNSIAAAVNRQGDWDNFPVAYILGRGVRRDVHLRTRDIFIRIDERIAGLKDSFGHLGDIASFLQTLQEDIQEWRKDFLSRVAREGRARFIPYLRQATKMWDRCEERYGAGAGYRSAVSEIFQEQFENEAGATLEQIESRVKEIWNQMIVGALESAAAFDDED